MKIHKCASCGSYTLRDSCPRCDSPAYHSKPPKYSPQDPYGTYRRLAKKENA